MKNPFKTAEGTPLPLGTKIYDTGVNFSLYSKNAETAALVIFTKERDILAEISLDPVLNKTGDIWHIFVSEAPIDLCYGWKVFQKGKASKLLEQQEIVVLDPYAKAVSSHFKWGECLDYKPLGLLVDKGFDWEGDKHLKIPREDLIIYEMHVRGFTEHTSSNANHPGTFLGVIEKIPYLLDLGVNAIELLPVHEFNECEYRRFNPFTGARLFNYWGYSTINFFSPCNRYASSDAPLSTINDFKTMVKELHKNGIEVLLDVVFNHTGEGNEWGPILSFKGIDLAVYYQLDPKLHYLNFSGCGNTMNCQHPMMRQFILSCLNYWAGEMHVDGFRFDLAAIFMRGTKGEVLESGPIIEAISEDPLLSGIKLIAEPWDSGGLYRLGQFYPEENRWSEWNDKFRDTTKRFIKGDKGLNRDFASRMAGSQDIFYQRSPIASVNYITSHDGFSLRDLVSYNQKHNSENAEDNADGNPNTSSWNCGAEGETKDKTVLSLRQRQMRNFHLALFVSNGIPMMGMGDEMGHTRFGNNNAWCQDNTINWFNWDDLSKNAFHRFTKELIHFRKRNKVLRQGRFLTDEDIDWHSNTPFKPKWEEESSFLAFTLKDHESEGHLYIAFNACYNEVALELPPTPPHSRWYVIVNTAGKPPGDIYHENEAPVLASRRFTMKSYSSVLFKVLKD